MAGTVPVSGNLSMAALGDTLTREEELGFVQVTGLAMDPTQVRNLVTTISQSQQLGTLTVCAAGSGGTGTKILSSTVYISGVKTAIDLFRSA